MDTNQATLAKLRAALAAGAIDQATFDAAAGALQAQLTGGGAIAQGAGAQSVGASSVLIDGNNSGDINLGVIIQHGLRPGARKDDLRRAYLARMLDVGNHLALFAGDTNNAQIKLTSVYTALLTRRTAGPIRAGQRLKGLANSDPWYERPLSALEVLNSESKLVLLGGPGSGKSTFVNFVALAMAGALLKLPAPNLTTLRAPLPADVKTENAIPQRWDHPALLPVQVTLRDLAAQLPPPGMPIDAQVVWRYMTDRLRQCKLEAFAQHLETELFEQGGLVMFDGLDEVPDAENRREQIQQAVQQFAATHTRCRYLVTSRTYAYQRQDWKLDDFAQVELQPFTQPQIQRFVDTWYAHMVELARLSQAAAQERADLLKRDAARNERLRELAERPLLLTLIAQLQTEAGGSLPERREELYQRAVDMLLNKWEGLKVFVGSDGKRHEQPSLSEWLKANRDDIRRQLNRLAFEAHRDQPRLTGTADIPQMALMAALLRASNRPDVQLLRLEEFLRDRAGILAEHGVGMYQFPHRSFQEYLAACHLTDDNFPDTLAELSLADPNRWREVALLAGAKAARGTQVGVWALCESLSPGDAPAENVTALEVQEWGALLAGRVLVECADLAHIAVRDTRKRDRVRDWQVHILGSDALPPVERALAGRTLAALGDPRPEVMTLDGMQFCLVPPGPFSMGSERQSNERPRHRVDLPYAYFIGRFPVSVAQWCEYLNRTGKSFDGNGAALGRPNEPVTAVSWHEALGLCAWLTQIWSRQLPVGFEACLPSEAEWEKAARGTKQLPAASAVVNLAGIQQALATATPLAGTPNLDLATQYPWGPDFDANRANTSESSIGSPSALGCFSMGSSAYGCEDMAGNVWEWTRSLWGIDLARCEFAYPYSDRLAQRELLTAPEEVLRVARGGAAEYSAGSARCASRSGFLPRSSGTILGLRVVLRSCAQ